MAASMSSRTSMSRAKATAVSATKAKAAAAKAPVARAKKAAVKTSKNPRGIQAVAGRQTAGKFTPRKQPGL